MVKKATTWSERRQWERTLLLLVVPVVRMSPLLLCRLARLRLHPVPPIDGAQPPEEEEDDDDDGFGDFEGMDDDTTMVVTKRRPLLLLGIPMPIPLQILELLLRPPCRRLHCPHRRCHLN